MLQREIHWLFVIASILAIILFTIQTLAASPVSVPPPSTVEVTMYRLQSNGRIYEPTPGIPATCATPENQDRWGCTAFDADQTLNFDNVVVSYPYGNVLTTEVSFETDYLMDVVPQEMSVDPAESAALQAQSVVARTYAMNGVDAGLDNSTNDQVFIPYRFDFLRVEGGDIAHNPQTTPTPNVADCSTIPATGVTRYQRETCDAVNGTNGIYIVWYTNGGWDDAPAFTEFFADAVLQTTLGGEPYLVSVDDPISRPTPDGDATSDGHGRGLSTKGAIRWAKGDTCAYGSCSLWSVTWNDYRQILVHYYTGIDIGQDAGGWFQQLAPDDRWNLLDYSNPTEMENNRTYTLTLVAQNTSVGDWDQSIELTYQWTAPGASPYDNGDDAWQTAIYGLSLATGATATLTVAITTPNNVGDYDLHWDFVRRGEGSIWFGAPSPWSNYDPWPHLIIPVTITTVGTPTPTPTPTPTNTPTNTPTPTPTFTPSATPTPTNTPPPTNTPTVTPTPTPVTPTPTPTPCAAQAAMQDASKDEQTHTLNQLYQLRDEFLAKEGHGQVYIDLYYRYSPEIVGLLLKDATLRQQTQEVIETMLPVMEPLISPKSKPSAVTTKQVEAMDKVLATLQTQASSELAKEIGWWREQMKDWSGLTAKEIWDKVGHLRQ